MRGLETARFKLLARPLAVGLPAGLETPGLEALGLALPGLEPLTRDPLVLDPFVLEAFAREPFNLAPLPRPLAWPLPLETPLRCFQDGAADLPLRAGAPFVGRLPLPLAPCAGLFVPWLFAPCVEPCMEPCVGLCAPAPFFAGA